jgi:hypothetical protein
VGAWVCLCEAMAAFEIPGKRCALTTREILGSEALLLMGRDQGSCLLKPTAIVLDEETPKEWSLAGIFWMR